MEREVVFGQQLDLILKAQIGWVFGDFCANGHFWFLNTVSYLYFKWVTGSLGKNIGIKLVFFFFFLKKDESGCERVA